MENETGVGSIPITFRFAADHVLIHGPIELLEYLLVFYYVILETKPQFHYDIILILSDKSAWFKVFTKKMFWFL